MGDKSSGLNFSVEMAATTDLAYNEDRADALLTIRAAGAGAQGASPARAAEVLIMDRSLSMASHGKLNEAKRAMCAAVDALPDGTLLGIVAGDHRAEVIFPAAGGLARVDAAAKQAAVHRIQRQVAQGGTAIGAWLSEADALFATVPDRGTVRHAVLFTDGKDEHETPEELGRVLEQCADRFVCDARGLGGDWNFEELLRITSALHGSADAVVTASDLTRDFTRLMEQARRIVVPRVYLGLWLSDAFRLGFVRQIRPTVADLTAQQQIADGEIQIPLGSWAPEERQYQVSLRFDPDALHVDDEVRAARITLRAETADAAREPCADPLAFVVKRLATPDFPNNRPGTEGLTQAENVVLLGMAMQACADAYQGGRLEESDREFRKSLVLAELLGDLRRLQTLRDLGTTGPDGLPQLRRDLDRGQIQRLGLKSVQSGPVGDDALQGSPAGLVTHTCPECHAVTTAHQAKYCENCGHTFGAGADAPSRPGRSGGPDGSEPAGAS